MTDWSRRGFLGVAASAAATAPALTQSGSPGLDAALLDRLRTMMAEAKVPGAGVTVVHEGAVVAAQGLGFASPAFQAAADERTLFHLGSVGKQLTAALVLELVEAGAIVLNDPLGRHVRDLPGAFADTPIHTLLSHTSGIADYENLPGFEPDRSIDRAGFLTGAATLPREFAPGEAWAYSNTGYVLLGYLLADVTGRSYAELIQARLFGPIGLGETRVDDARAIILGRAEPHVLQDGVVRHALRMDGGFSGWPDGGVLMSARDAARWELALQSGPVPSRATADHLTRPALMNSGRSTAYGAGWFTDSVGGREFHIHSGSVPGYLTFAARAPATRTAVTVMVNLESGPAATFMRQACLMLMEAVAPGSTPLPLTPIEDDAPETTAATLALLGRGERPLDPAMFTSEIAGLMGRPAARIVQPPNLGADPTDARLELIERIEEPGGQVRRYRLSRTSWTRHIAFAHAPDGRIYRVRLL